MKYNPLYVAALSAALACSAGCTMEEPETTGKANAPQEVYQVHFVAEQIETRTVFGTSVSSSGENTYPTLWSGNEDKIAVSLNLSGAKGATVIASNDGKKAEFDADFSASTQEAPYVFYALSPFSACVGATSSHGGYHLSIPAEQTPLATSCDESAQLIVASETAQTTGEFGSIELNFKHVTAYGKLTLTNMALVQGETIQSIDLTSSTPFTGQFYYDFSQDALSESSPSHTVTIMPDNLVFTGKNSPVVYDSSDIWFACSPADLSGGTLKVVLNTNLGRWTRTVNIPENSLAFKAGRVSKFAVNMTTAVFEGFSDRWVLVTDASSLKAGDEIIVASSASAGSAYAMSTTQNNNNRGSTSISVATDNDGKTVIQNPGSSVETLTLVSGAYNGYFYLMGKNGQYLYTTSSTSKNYLYSGAVSTATNSTNKGYSNWKFYVSDKVATVVAYQTSSNYYKQIRYNPSNYNRIFAAYRSSSQTSMSGSSSNTSNIYVFRKESGVSSGDDPILQYEQYGAYVYGGNHLYGSGSQMSREYEGDGTVCFAIVSPAVFEIAEFGGIPVDPAKGDSFTLNYNLISGRNRTDSDYNVTVVKVDGPKVWLSAGSGYGFIVKK